jgi:cytoskeletal protein CcmA (bactofilin family)
MTMGLFNNESDKMAGHDPLILKPESPLAQAASVAQPTGPDASKAPFSHRRTYAQMTDTRVYLDQGSKISGKLKFEGPAQIDGQVDGEISAKDMLVIGDSAVVSAQIEASSIIVAGKLSGEIVASERIEIRPSAKVSGNLKAPKLIVHEGAIFDGNCAMQPEEVRENRKSPKLRKEEHIPERANYLGATTLAGMDKQP